MLLRSNFSCRAVISVCCSWIALISIGTNTEYLTDFLDSLVFLSIDSSTNDGKISSNS